MFCIFSGTTPMSKRLKKSAVPSQFSWTDAQTPEASQRGERATKRGVKRNILQDITNEVKEEEEQVFFNFDTQEVEIMEAEIEPAQKDAELQTFTPSVCNSETQTPADVKPVFSVFNFQNDSAGIHFYTGLENYVKFCFVLNTLGPAAFCLNYVYHTVVNVHVLDQFFIVLMKLRRHTTNFELSRMFGVSESTISNIVLTWILFMSKQWKELNLWPERDLVHYYAPAGFKKQFPNTRVIVDGTECPVKKPKSAIAQQSTFSSYKNRNTVKTLIGATPGGLVSYVSNAYGGSTSDRQIVERSALVDMCDPKDSVMADKGFNVQDLFASRDVSINIPTFFRKKNRMSGETVVRDRKISSKRVHIERIIGLGKTYKILVEPMSGTETKMASEIIFICYMLCNFRKCIVPAHA